jgi:hypothetical protein
MTPNALATFSVENILNQQFTRYMAAYPFPDATVSGAFPLNFASPGITVKGSLRVRFADGIVEAQESKRVVK